MSPTYRLGLQDPLRNEPGRQRLLRRRRRPEPCIIDPSTNKRLVTSTSSTVSEPTIGLGFVSADGADRIRSVVAGRDRMRRYLSRCRLGYRRTRRGPPNGTTVDERSIVRLKGALGLEAMEFSSGPEHLCGGLFFATGQHQRSELAARLGCAFTPEGTVATGEYETTCVSGLFVAGDASRRMQLAIVAAAEGADAAAVMNSTLLKLGQR